MSVYVVTAAFCERLLNEKDGVASLIRIIDRVQEVVRIPTSAQESTIETGPLVYPLTFYIALWADAPGTHQVDVAVAYETGRREQVVSQQVEFSEARQGRNISIGFQGFPAPGLLWTEVSLDGELRTRTPLTLQRELDTPAP